MRYLWDTNILVHYIRKSEKFDQLSLRYGFFSNDNQIFLSIISIGEIQSLAYQLNWGLDRRLQLQKFIENISLLEIYEEVVTAYAQIDAYSQGKLKRKPLPLGLSARNMGKNDVWLAATAHAFDLAFVTTDSDFDHLNGVFLTLVKAG